MGNAYVILPTYKERENLQELIQILEKYNVNIVIVDDNSNDGTIELIESLNGTVIYKDKNIKIDGKKDLILIERERERGLSSAVLDGIKYVKSIEDDAKIIVMDADFQHNPSIIPDIIELLNKYDIVEAVRKNKESLGFFRKIISNTAEKISKLLIPELKEVRDPLTGYFGFKLNKVNVDKIKPKGYKIFLDIFINSTRNIGHIYYEFGKRRYGKSKLSFKTIIDYILQLLELNEYRIIKYGIVGLSGIFVNEGIAWLLHTYTSLPLWAIFAISVETSINTNFLLNNYWTFRKRSNLRAILKHNYYMLAAWFLNVILATLLSYLINYLIANLIAIIIVMILRYSIAEHVIWKIE